MNDLDFTSAIAIPSCHASATTRLEHYLRDLNCLHHELRNMLEDTSTPTVVVALAVNRLRRAIGHFKVEVESIGEAA